MKPQTRFLLVGLVLSMAGCTVHYHSEFRAGKGSAETSGGQRTSETKASRPQRPSKKATVVRVGVGGSGSARAAGKASGAGDAAASGGSATPKPVTRPPRRPVAPTPAAGAGAASGSAQANGSGAGSPIASAASRGSASSSSASGQGAPAVKPAKPVARVVRPAPAPEVSDNASLSPAPARRNPDSVAARRQGAAKPGSLADRRKLVKQEDVVAARKKPARGTIAARVKPARDKPASTRAKASSSVDTKPAGKVRVSKPVAAAAVKGTSCAPYARKVAPGEVVRLRVRGLSGDGKVLLDKLELPLKSKRGSVWVLSVPADAKTGTLHIVQGETDQSCGRLTISGS